MLSMGSSVDLMWLRKDSSELKDKSIETSRTEIQIKKRMKNISYRSLFTV